MRNGKRWWNVMCLRNIYSPIKVKVVSTVENKIKKKKKRRIVFFILDNFLSYDSKSAKVFFPKIFHFISFLFFSSYRRVFYFILLNLSSFYWSSFFLFLVQNILLVKKSECLCFSFKINSLAMGWYLKKEEYIIR